MDNLTDDVLLFVLKEISAQQSGTAKLARFESSSKKSSRLVCRFFSANVKKLVIKVPTHSPTSISINGCKFKDVQDSPFDFEQPILLDAIRNSLLYLLSRTTVITKLITKGFFKYRPGLPQFLSIADDLKSSPKLQLGTLILTPFWTQLLTGVMIENCTTLKTLFMTTSGIDTPLENSLSLQLDKFIFDFSHTDATDQQHRFNNLLSSLIDGGSRTETLMIKGGFAASMYGQEEDESIFSRLIQTMKPESLIWNGIVVNYFGFGTVEDGDITQTGSWFEFALKSGIGQENLRILDVKQAYLQNWGLLPFDIAHMKICFPNLQELRMYSTYQINPLTEIPKIRQFISDLFENWPELHTKIRFRFMRLARHAAVINYTEAEKEIVANLPKELQTNLTNLAHIRTCARDHQHLQPKLEVVSTFNARVILEFIVDACNVGDAQPVGGHAGSAVHFPSDEDRCVFLDEC